jgi:ribosome-associated protein
MAIRFVIRGEGIQLDQLLKATGLCPSGGAAKAQIAAGLVKLDGSVETRKRAQLRPGQVVEYEGETIELAKPGPEDVAPARETRTKKSEGAPAKSAPPAKPKGAAPAKRPRSTRSQNRSKNRPPRAGKVGPRGVTASTRPGARGYGSSRGDEAGLWPTASGRPTTRAADRASTPRPGTRARPPVRKP